jgi:hypothetical protein
MVGWSVGWVGWLVGSFFTVAGAGREFYFVRRRHTYVIHTYTQLMSKCLKIVIVGDITSVASIGDIRYSDYLQHDDEERRRRYKARHEPHRHKKGTPGYYADQILW